MLDFAVFSSFEFSLPKLLDKLTNDLLWERTDLTKSSGRKSVYWKKKKKKE